MTSRYPKRKRAVTDYAAIASGKAPAQTSTQTAAAKETPVVKISRTGKAQATPIPRGKRVTVSKAAPAAKKTAKKSPPSPPKKVGRPAKRVRRTAVERPEPEPLDQNSDGGPDAPSPDPSVHTRSLSDSSSLSEHSSSELSESSLGHGLRLGASRSVSPRTRPSTAGKSSATEPLFGSVGALHSAHAAHAASKIYYDSSTDEDSDERGLGDDWSEDSEWREYIERRGIRTYAESSGPDRGLDSEEEEDVFPGRYLIEPTKVPMDEIARVSFDEAVQLIGMVVYFVRNVKKIQIPTNTYNPVYLIGAMNGRDSMWNDKTINWKKYHYRAWRHRWHMSDQLRWMNIGHVAALLNATEMFRLELEHKGIRLWL